MFNILCWLLLVRRKLKEKYTTSPVRGTLVSGVKSMKRHLTSLKVGGSLFSWQLVSCFIAFSTTVFVWLSFVATSAHAGLPGVLFVLPDSYVDAENKDYGGTSSKMSLRLSYQWLQISIICMYVLLKCSHGLLLTYNKVVVSRLKTWSSYRLWSLIALLPWNWSFRLFYFLLL